MPRSSLFVRYDEFATHVIDDAINYLVRKGAERRVLDQLLPCMVWELATRQGWHPPGVTYEQALKNARDPKMKAEFRKEFAKLRKEVRRQNPQF